MKKKIKQIIIPLFGFALSLFLNGCTSSNSKIIKWQKTIGGSQREWPSSVINTNDGGFLVAGASASSDGNIKENKGDDNYDLIIVKFNAKKEIEWQKVIGGSGQDYYPKAIQTKDGDYVLAVQSDSRDGDVAKNIGADDIWIIKLNKSGETVWQQNYGGTATDEVGDIIELSNGGFLVAGTSNSNDGDVIGDYGEYDGFVLILNEKGEKVISRNIGGTKDDYLTSAVQLPDGSFVLAGHTKSDDYDMEGNTNKNLPEGFLIAMDTNGTIKWMKFVSNRINQLKLTKDGRLMAAGTIQNINKTDNEDDEFDAWIAEFKNNGSIVWEKRIEGQGNQELTAIIQTADSGYLACGYSVAEKMGEAKGKGKQDLWLVKLNAKREISNQYLLGGKENDRAVGLLQMKDGNYIILGESESSNGDIKESFGDADIWLAELYLTR